MQCSATGPSYWPKHIILAQTHISYWPKHIILAQTHLSYHILYWPNHIILAQTHSMLLQWSMAHQKGSPQQNLSQIHGRCATQETANRSCTMEPCSRLRSALGACHPVYCTACLEHQRVSLPSKQLVAKGPSKSI